MKFTSLILLAGTSLLITACKEQETGKKTAETKTEMKTEDKKPAEPTLPAELKKEEAKVEAPKTDMPMPERMEEKKMGDEKAHEAPARMSVERSETHEETKKP